MRTWFFLILSLLSINVYADKVMTPAEVIEIVKNSDFQFLFRGQLSNFYSTKSCVFQFADILLVRNYCHEDKSIPAKSYYIISPELGLHYFYEENMGQVTKREVNIRYFPEQVSMEWNGQGPITLNKLDEILQNLYKAYGPACWVTNYSPYVGGPHSSCFKEEISHFPQWKSDSENLVFDVQRWEETLKSLRQAAKR
ncbi:MAG: hypothetical protein KDD40_02460 [Bdellovibrionales bacterium]|nr:hypothetical protein [Bdellovibrionales bacterium]